VFSSALSPIIYTDFSEVLSVQPVDGGRQVQFVGLETSGATLRVFPHLYYGKLRRMLQRDRPSLQQQQSYVQHFDRNLLRRPKIHLHA
jgi:hypothetical protein